MNQLFAICLIILYSMFHAKMKDKSWPSFALLHIKILYCLSLGPIPHLKPEGRPDISSVVLSIPVALGAVTTCRLPCIPSTMKKTRWVISCFIPNGFHFSNIINRDAYKCRGIDGYLQVRDYLTNYIEVADEVLHILDCSRRSEMFTHLCVDIHSWILVNE